MSFDEVSVMIANASVTPPYKPRDHPGSVDHLLATICAHLGMEVAFVSQAADGEVRIRNASGGVGLFVVGDSFAEEDGYCKRILDGRIPYLITDTATVPEIPTLSCTLDMPIGSHISVPVVLSDGRIYGTFCCFSSEPNYSLTDRDMHAFAALAAGQIENEISEGEITKGVVDRIYSTIHNETLSVVYQPICRLEANVPVGVECLARFPDGALRPPCEWFAEPAEVGLGIELELVAIQAALRGLPIFRPTSTFQLMPLLPRSSVAN